MKVRSCDFCGKDQTKVSRMISAPSGVDICNECIFLFMEILMEESKKGYRIKIDTKECIEKESE